MAGLAKKPEDRPKTCADVLKVNFNAFQSSGKNREGERPREPDYTREGAQRHSEVQQRVLSKTIIFAIIGGILTLFCVIGIIGYLANSNARKGVRGDVNAERIFAEQESNEYDYIEPKKKAENTRLAIALFEAEHWNEGYRLCTKADLNDKSIQFYLAKIYNMGYGVPKNESEAVRWYRKSAMQGYAKAQNNLGVMYANGQGVAKDESEAVKWYRKAAEQGCAHAQHNLAVMYANGQGVAKDEREAVKWYRKAAEQGNARAQYNLGVMYADGCGVAQNGSVALKWYRKAAEQGHALAQYRLALIYRFGWGVSKDKREAVRWFRKSAEQGYARAQFYLAMMYDTEFPTEAVKWYRKAAEQGDADAQYCLGNIYLDGYVVPKDESEAVKWYRKSAEQGHEPAKEALKRLGY